MLGWCLHTYHSKRSKYSPCSFPCSSVTCWYHTIQLSLQNIIRPSLKHPFRSPPPIFRQKAKVSAVAGGWGWGVGGGCCISQTLPTSLPSLLSHVSHPTSTTSSDQPDMLCPTVSQLADLSATGGARGGRGGGGGGGGGGNGGGDGDEGGGGSGSELVLAQAKSRG